MGKYRLIAQYLMEDGLISPGEFMVPEPVEFDTAAHAHSAGYVRQVFTANVEPAISREIGFDVNPSVAMRARLSSGATLAAARLALQEGVATSTAGGSHHAGRDQGRGFCVFNDVAIAAANLIADGDARQIMIVDCDVHQGDGTAEIFAGNDRVTTISIHNEKNYPARKKPSDLDLGLADGLEDAGYLKLLAEALEQASDFPKPDVVFYNAGVDVHRDDRLGRLSMSDEGIVRRDRAVISYFTKKGIPVAAVQGGGYSNDVEAVARRHTIIHHVAAEFV
jgi:acetoin utilization deacetylase AcuC-like enzyme